MPTETAAREIVQLKVTLRGSSPAIWRRLVVPGEATLLQLHDVLQLSFGWLDEHLHVFTSRGKQYGSPDPDDFGRPTLDEAETKLRDVAAPRTKIVYEYDFGDSWMVDLVVEKILPAPATAKKPSLTCLAGHRAGPPDDSGGVWGYEQKLQILADPDHEEHEDILDWMGHDFSPDFDKAALNRELEALARSWKPATKKPATKKQKKAKPQPIAVGPLSDEDAAELCALIEGAALLDIDGMLGLMHAVVVAPSLVPPSAWLPHVLDSARLAPDADPQRSLDLIMRVYNDVADALAEGETVMPDSADGDACEAFAKGYVIGASLDPTWVTNADAWMLAAPFAVVCGERELAPPEMLARIDAQRNWREAFIEEMDVVIVETRRLFLEMRESGQALTASAPARAAVRVGRNDPCPCGKGKKFKKCCGA